MSVAKTGHPRRESVAMQFNNTTQAVYSIKAIRWLLPNAQASTLLSRLSLQGSHGFKTLDSITRWDPHPCLFRMPMPSKPPLCCLPPATCWNTERKWMRGKRRIKAPEPSLLNDGCGPVVAWAFLPRERGSSHL